MAKQMVSIELQERQIQFLDQMVENYALADRGKALRCLVDYAQDSPDQQDSVFNQIRCLDC